MTRCDRCSGVVSWRDCDLHPDDECFATECDGSGGCGRIDRDCQSVETELFDDGYRHINRYFVESVYGGPEEGGWWYDHYTPVASSPRFEMGSQEYLDALEQAREWEATELDRKRQFGERGRTSVIGTADPVVLVESHVAAVYPTVTPHYE